MLDNPKNSNCDLIDQRISYLYDELLGQEKISFEKHLKNCFSCRAELSGFSMIRENINEWRQTEFVPLETPIIEIPYQRVEKIEEKISWFDSIRKFFSFSPMWATASALSALVVCFILTIVLFYSNSSRSNELLVRNETKIEESNSQVANEPVGAKETENIKNDPPKPVVVTTNKPTETVLVPKTVSHKVSVNQKTAKKIAVKSNQKVQSEKQINIAPSFFEEEEEVETLRLTDLLDEVAAR